MSTAPKCFGSEEIYISVDIEASGPIPGTYSMLSLGACVVSDISSTFYRELQPITANYVSEALEVNKLSLEALRMRGERPNKVMEDFRDWIRIRSSGQTAVFVGFNASFDWQFVNWYFHTYIGENPFGVAALDIKAYYMGKLDCKWCETRARSLIAKYGNNNTLTHNALDDARAQASIFKRLISNK